MMVKDVSTQRGGRVTFICSIKLKPHKHQHYLTLRFPSNSCPALTAAELKEKVQLQFINLKSIAIKKNPKESIYQTKFCIGYTHAKTKKCLDAAKSLRSHLFSPHSHSQMALHLKATHFCGCVNNHMIHLELQKNTFGASSPPPQYWFCYI